MNTRDGISALRGHWPEYLIEGWALGMFMISAGLVTTLFFGWLPLCLPELFPTSLRSTGTSFCYNVGRIIAATAPFTMSQITKRLGGDIEGFRTAGMCVSLVLLVGTTARNSRRR